jgi:hypothetical protein
MISKLKNRFSRSEEGSLSVETVLTVPILVWAIVATFVFWDAFKTLNLSQKATYTIADMLSREQNVVNDDYIASMHEIFDLLAGESGQNAIRVSVVTRSPDANGIEDIRLVWSEGSGVVDLPDIEPLRDRLPTIANGEHIIVGESEQRWSPAFAVGLASYRFREVALSRPRFTAQLCFEVCTNPNPVNSSS